MKVPSSTAATPAPSAAPSKCPSPHRGGINPRPYSRRRLVLPQAAEPSLCTAESWGAGSDMASTTTTTTAGAARTRSETQPDGPSPRRENSNIEVLASSSSNTLTVHHNHYYDNDNNMMNPPPSKNMNLTTRMGTAPTAVAEVKSPNNSSNSPSRGLEPPSRRVDAGDDAGLPPMQPPRSNKVFPQQQQHHHQQRQYEFPLSCTSAFRSSANNGSSGNNKNNQKNMSQPRDLTIAMPGTNTNTTQSLSLVRMESTASSIMSELEGYYNNSMAYGLQRQASRSSALQRQTSRTGSVGYGSNHHRKIPPATSIASANMTSLVRMDSTTSAREELEVLFGGGGGGGKGRYGTTSFSRSASGRPELTKSLSGRSVNTCATPLPPYLFRVTTQSSVRRSGATNNSTALDRQSSIGSTSTMGMISSHHYRFQHTNDPGNRPDNPVGELMLRQQVSTGSFGDQTFAAESVASSAVTKLQQFCEGCSPEHHLNHPQSYQHHGFNQHHQQRQQQLLMPAHQYPQQFSYYQYSNFQFSYPMHPFQELQEPGTGQDLMISRWEGYGNESGEDLHEAMAAGAMAASREEAEEIRLLQAAAAAANGPYENADNHDVLPAYSGSIVTPEDKDKAIPDTDGDWRPSAIAFKPFRRASM